MLVTHDVPTTQIAVRLRQAMGAENLGINDLAKELEMTYEHIRRLVRGLNNPSPAFLKVLCNRFGWNQDEMKTVLVQDRFRKRNGPEGVIAQPRVAEVEPFERGWHLLKQHQKDALTALLQQYVEQNRRRSKTA